MHRTRVRLVEDVLDANDTIARSNRDDFDRHGVTVVNLMSAPGAGKTRLLERALDGLAEGEDKPLKYPLMFRACELVVVNKIDLLEHLDFDLELLEANLQAVHPGVRCIRASARTGEGIAGLREWFAQVNQRAAAVV